MNVVVNDFVIVILGKIYIVVDFLDMNNWIIDLIGLLDCGFLLVNIDVEVLMMNMLF